MMTQQDTWLTRTQAASHAGVDLRTIDRWIAAGLLTRYRRGHRVLINTRELDTLMEPRKT